MLKKTAIAPIIASIAFGLVAAAPAGAITSKSFKYSSPKTGYLQIPATDFAPDGTLSATSTYYNSWNGGDLTGLECYNTGIHLPHGAKIVEFSYAHVGAIYVELHDHVFSTGDYTTHVNLTSPAAATRTVETITFPTPITINNATMSYGIGVCLDTAESFDGARIKYTYTKAGD